MRSAMSRSSSTMSTRLMSSCPGRGVTAEPPGGQSILAFLRSVRKQADFRGFCAAPAGTPLDAKTEDGRQKTARGLSEATKRKAEKGKAEAGSWKLKAGS